MPGFPSPERLPAGRRLWIGLLSLTAALLLLLALDACQRGGRAMPEELTRLARALDLGWFSLSPAGRAAGLAGIDRERVDLRFVPGLPPAPNGLAGMVFLPPGAPR